MLTIDELYKRIERDKELLINLTEERLRIKNRIRRYKRSIEAFEDMQNDLFDESD